MLLLRIKLARMIVKALPIAKLKVAKCKDPDKLTYMGKLRTKEEGTKHNRRRNAPPQVPSKSDPDSSQIQISSNSRHSLQAQILCI